MTHIDNKELNLKNLKPVISGFLWGIGFSVAICLIFTAYTLNLSAQIQLKHQQDYNTLMNSNFVSLSELINIQIIKRVVKSNKVIIHSKYSNDVDTALLNSSFKIVFSLFSTNSEFMGNCESSIQSTYTNEEDVFMETICQPFAIEAKYFAHATASLVKRN